MNLKHIVFLTLFFCLTACSSDEPAVGTPPVGTEKALKTVLVYMVADNNLYGYSLDDLKEMKSGVSASDFPDDCRWIVYFSGRDNNPRLMEFDADGKESVLATYPTSESSVTISGMQTVLSDVERLAPAQSYGLVLWSHGTGWISDSGTLDEPSTATGSAITPYSFGYDGNSGKKMKITSLAQALAGRRFDFIYFDCCHMATVEIAYQLRKSTDVMIASPTELGVEGMPYDVNIRPLLLGQYDRAVDNTYRYYLSQYNSGEGFGCAISLLNLATIDDLADATRDVLSVNAELPESYSPVYYFRRNVIDDGVYEFDHYIKALCGSDTDLYSRWREAFNKVVSLHLKTSRVYMLDSSKFQGLGSHILRSKDELEVTGDPYGYRETAWWADVVSTVFN